MAEKNDNRVAVDAIKTLSRAIEKRRVAEAEVGKAHEQLAAVEAANAKTPEALNAALSGFREVAQHW
jgi:hypothetical protein